MKLNTKILFLVCLVSGFALAEDIVMQDGTGTWVHKDSSSKDGFIPMTKAQVSQYQAQEKETQTVTTATQLGQAAKQQMDAFDRSVKAQIADIDSRKASASQDWVKDELTTQRNILSDELKQEQKLKAMSPQDLAAYFKDSARNPTLNDSIEDTLGSERRWRTRWVVGSLVTDKGTDAISTQFEKYLESLKKAYQVDDQHVSNVADAIAGKAAPVVAAPAAAPVTPSVQTVVITAKRPVSRASVAPPTQTPTAIAAAASASNSAAASSVSPGATVLPPVATSTTSSPAAVTSTAPPRMVQSMGDGKWVPEGTKDDYHAPASAEDPNKCLGLQFSEDSMKKAGVDGKKASNLKENECVPGSYSVAPCKNRYYYDPEMQGQQCLMVCQHGIFSSSYSQDIYNKDILDLLNSPDTKDAAKQLLSVSGMTESQLREKYSQDRALSEQGRVPYANQVSQLYGDSDKLKQLAVALNKALPKDKSAGNYCDQMSAQSKTVIAQAEKGKDSRVTTTESLKKMASPDNYSLQAQCTNPNGDVVALKINHFFSSNELMVVESVKDGRNPGQVVLTYDYWDSNTNSWKNNVMQLQQSPDGAGLVNGDGDHLDLHQISANSLPKGFCNGTPAGTTTGTGSASSGPSTAPTGPGIK